jgi:hypothetical protein
MFLSAILSTSTSFRNIESFLYTRSRQCQPIETYLFFVLIRVDFPKSEVFDFLFVHEVVLHAALEVVDLEFLAPFRHQLVLVQACVVADGVLLTLVEVVQRKASFVRR